MRELLELAVPPYEGTGDWEAVLRDARVKRRVRVLRPVLAVALAAAALVVFLPSTSPLERALAAAGDGPVLHLVFESDLPKTFVDLESGARREVRGRHEVWFDAARDTAREREVFEGVVQWDTSGSAHPHQREIYTSLGTGYRDALRSGRATVVAEDAQLIWIRIAPGHDVAVSRDSYRPVSMRVGPDHETRILRYETVRAVPAGGSVLLPQPGPPEGTTISLREAERVLGRPPLQVRERPGSVQRVGDAVKIVYGPHREVTQATRGDGLSTLVGLRGYTPPDGTLVVEGTNGLMRSHGLYVLIAAMEPDTMIELARTLR